MKKTVVEMDKIFFSKDFNGLSEQKENLKYYTKQLKSWSKIINLMIFAMLLTNLIQWFDKSEYVRLIISLIVLVITVFLIIGKQKNKLKQYCMSMTQLNIIKLNYIPIRY